MTIPINALLVYKIGITHSTIKTVLLYA